MYTDDRKPQQYGYAFKPYCCGYYLDGGGLLLFVKS